MIHSFLTGRSVVMHLNESNITTTIEKGFPQGRTLSHFLWDIIIDEALRLELPAGVKIQAFADDLVLSKTGCNKSII